jgi:hypothetical protein
MLVIDLEAMRCPNAQIRLNAILNAFMNTGASGIEIKSIEPSLERSLRERIAHYDMPLTIAEIKQETINDEHKQKWLAVFDEEDFEDVTTVQSFILQKASK